MAQKTPDEQMKELDKKLEKVKKGREKKFIEFGKQAWENYRTVELEILKKKIKNEESKKDISDEKRIYLTVSQIE